MSEKKDKEDNKASSSSGGGSGKSHSQDDDKGEDFQERITSFLHHLAEQLPELSKKEDETPVLSEFTLEAVAKRIKDGNALNIIVMTGAGISTSAGIPDFRSPDMGLYTKLAKHGMKNPQSMFEINTFIENPAPFFELARELFPDNINPTPCHYFIKLLHDKGLLLRTYTQNIDTLERKAGLEDDKVVYAHGSQSTSTCMLCSAKYDYEWMRDRMFNSTGVPRCTKDDCGGVVKPDVVFFGEALPVRFFTQMKWDFPQCDLLIIMGTSLVVQPFANLIDRVGSRVPRLLINREAAGQGSDMLRMLGIGGGLDFESEKNYRDVWWQGTCDDGCRKLAELLGWKADLDKLINGKPESSSTHKPQNKI